MRRGPDCLSGSQTTAETSSFNTIARAEIGINRPAPPSFSFIMARRRRWLAALSDVFAKPLDERPQADLWHVRDQLVEHAALAEERMGPVFGRVGLEMPIHAFRRRRRAASRERWRRR